MVDSRGVLAAISSASANETQSKSPAILLYATAWLPMKVDHDRL